MALTQPGHRRHFLFLCVVASNERISRSSNWSNDKKPIFKWKMLNLTYLNWTNTYGTTWTTNCKAALSPNNYTGPHWCFKRVKYKELLQQEMNARGFGITCWITTYKCNVLLLIRVQRVQIRVIGLQMFVIAHFTLLLTEVSDQLVFIGFYSP